MTDAPDMPAPAVKTHKPRTRSIVSWLALLAILIAVGAWFQLVHQQKKSRNNYSQLQSSFSQTQLSTAELSTEFSQLKRQLREQNEQLLALATAVNRSQAVNADQALDNTLTDVNHLLLQANLNLHFNHNISNTILLLQTADQHLSDLSDPGIFTLRNQIATVLVNLSAIAQPDLVGLLSQIAAISSQVNHLPLFALSDKTAQFKHVTNSQPSTHETWYSKGLRLSLETLKSLVIIRHQDQAVTPLLAPMQEQFLRQNLQLMLQQAAWAVLQHQPGVYLFSLNQASEWLQRYFADNDHATIALTAQLNALKKVDIAPVTPDLNPLLQNVHDLQRKYVNHLTLTKPRLTVKKDTALMGAAV